jgi:hypothetical protein
MPAALFVNGNSSVNIRSTKGILIDKDKQITRAVFGQGPKDEKFLGKGVYKQYGVASEGFDVCSIQFAIHYMFESQETLHNFLQNVSEVTKEGGYFIGTSYDGEKLFNMIKNIPENDSKIIMATDEKTGYSKRIWEIIKRYDHDEFNDDETCIGYAIDVFQESINKTIREYLVNYTYLTRILENYGFVLASTEDLKNLGSDFTSPTGLFNDLFNKMNDSIKKNPRLSSSYKDAPLMTDGERTISFLNRYFIYKKVRKVSDVGKVSMNLQNKTVDEEMDEPEEGSVQANKSVSFAAVDLSETSTTEPTTKTKTKIKPKTTTTATKTKIKIPKQKLSTIQEGTNEISLLPVAAAQAEAPAAAEDKPKVKKLKRVMKISNTDNN